MNDGDVIMCNNLVYAHRQNGVWWVTHESGLNSGIDSIPMGDTAVGLIFDPNAKDGPFFNEHIQYVRREMLKGYTNQ